MSEPTPDDTQPIKDLLAEHVPLALLVDLLGADPRTSSQILAEEGLPEEAWWEGVTEADGRPDRDAGGGPENVPG